MPLETSETFACPFLSFKYGERTIDFRLSNKLCVEEKIGTNIYDHFRFMHWPGYIYSNYFISCLAISEVVLLNSTSLWDPTVLLCRTATIHDREYVGNFKTLPNTKYYNFVFLCRPWLLLLPIAVYCQLFLLTQ